MINPRRLMLLTVLLLCCGLAAEARCQERYAVSSSIVNIRQGPGKNHDILWQVEKYFPVEVVEKQGDWFKFRDYEGDQGWIHSSLLDRTDTVIVKKGECNVRQGPGTNFPIAFKVQSGVPFKVINIKDDWIHIRHADGDSGWIYKPLVW